jgi:hypothetical protein
MLEEITYEYFCALGGLSHPKCYTRVFRNGSYVYSKYYKRG